PDRVWARSTFASLWRSWRHGTTYGRWDAWSPYVASLRAWTLCGVHAELVAGTDLAAEVAASLADHAGYVRANLERDVGGNHLLKNLKALVGTGVFLGDGALVAEASAAVVDQLAIQVLPDGGHHERSPS